MLQNYTWPSINKLSYPLQFAAWFLLLGSLLPIISHLIIPEIATIILFFLTAFGLIWVIIIWKKGIELLVTPLDLSLFIFFIVLLITTLNSIDPSRSWRIVWRWSTFILVFYIAVSLFRAGASIHAFRNALLFVMGIFILFALASIYLWLVNWYQIVGFQSILPTQLPPRVSSFANGAGRFATLLNIPLMLAVPYLYSENRLRVSWWWLWLILAVFALVLTGARGGWVATIAGLLTFIFGKLWWQQNQSQKASKFNLKTIIRPLLLSTFLIILGIFLASILRPTNLSESLTVRSISSGRTILWLIAIHIWQSHPLLGSGLNTYPSFYFLDDISNFKNGIAYFNYSAHNFFLQVLAEMGIIGLASSLFFLWQLGSGIKQRLSIPSRWSLFTISYISALIAIGVNSLFEMPQPPVMFICAIVLAALINDLYPLDELLQKPFWRVHCMAIWPFIGLVILLTGWQGIQVSKGYMDSISEINKGNWTNALDDLQSAQDHLPWKDTSIELTTGFAKGVTAGTTNANDLTEAIKSYQQGISKEPGWSPHYANLASLYWQQGQTEKAIQLLEEAIDITPKVPAYHLNLGLWHEELGNNDGAIAAYANLYNLQQNWYLSPFWQNELANKAIIQTQAKPLMNIPEEEYMEANGYLALKNSDLEMTYNIFSELLDQNPTSGKYKTEMEAIGYLALENDNFNIAYRIFSNAIEKDPMSGNSYLALGITQLFMGDYASAEKALENAKRLTSGETATLVKLWQAQLLSNKDKDIQPILNQLKNTEHTIYGEGIIGQQSYMISIFARETLPHDFLPQLKCFTLSPNNAIHLTLLRDRYQQQGDESNIIAIDHVLNGEGNGLTSCLMLNKQD